MAITWPRTVDNTIRYRMSPACISDIFSHGSEINRLGEHLKLFPGVTFIRNRAKLSLGQKESGQHGKKGKIVTFSDKSRRMMMITLAQMEEVPKFWQDFTFADDVMMGKSIAEKAIISAKCLKLFKQEIERSGLKVDGIWKKEWKKRKSGNLKGLYVPHFHMVYTLPGMDAETYEAVCKKLAALWVKITGTEEEAKALSVALHPRSYRFINSRKQMQKYMSKYMVKNEKNEMLITDESIGRNWGRLGSPKMAEEEIIELTEREMTLLKRCLRKMAKRAKGVFRQMLQRRYTQFFMMTEKATIIRYIEFIRVQENFPGVPF